MLNKQIEYEKELTQKETRLKETGKILNERQEDEKDISDFFEKLDLKDL